MARQPFLKHPAVLKDRFEPNKWQMGSQARLERPEHISKIGECITLWPDVDTQLALLLASFMGANARASVAVYSILRRSTGRVEALKAAANAHLDIQGQQIIAAVCTFLVSVEGQRNDLAHGQWGASRLIPDAILWMDGSKAIDFHINHRHNAIAGNKNISKIEVDLFYYKINDFDMLIKEILMLCEIIFGIRIFIDGFHKADSIYRTTPRLLTRLENYAPIRPALQRIRDGVDPPTPPEPQT